MRRRKLREDERELWARVAATTTAIHNHAAQKNVDEIPPASLPVIGQNTGPEPEIPLYKAFRMGQNAAPLAAQHKLLPPLRERLADAPVMMDKKAHRAMLRGKLEPEARLDMHGLTLAEAYPELIRFILASHSRGCRLVLVITGKGKAREDWGPIPQRMGVLRHQVPQWLRLPPVNALILQINEASAKHGGGGAYYVYLRRQR